MKQKLHLDRAHLLAQLKQMLRIRRFEEKCAELYALEKIRGFLHLYIGEEAIAVGVMSTLSAKDNIVATYREHGHALARGLSMKSILAECTVVLMVVAEGAVGQCTYLIKAKIFMVVMPLLVVVYL
jgi:TPP-dependent pyruvate/acetoin dehydrogenase alpha subunit